LISIYAKEKKKNLFLNKPKIDYFANLAIVVALFLRMREIKN
jgi:hypothetical protein